MQLGYTIIYVPDVAASIAFYERAFGLIRGFVHDGGDYGELATGATTLAFAAERMAASHGIEIRPNSPHTPPAGFELAFVTADPEAAVARAVAAGATVAQAVETKPWGQRVGYVRDLDGCLVELCTPMGG
jgi:catechol 2,3-dioxygenase-like lactoylglutathione lyase family enzyme